MPPRAPEVETGGTSWFWEWAMPFLEFYHEAGQWAAATVFEAVQQTLEETLPCRKRPSGAPTTSQKQPHDAPKAIFGSKKRANQAQESSKTNLDALFGRSRGPQEFPRAPPKAPQSSPREPQHVFKNIIGSEKLILQKYKESHSNIIIFEGWKVSLGAQNRPQEAPIQIQT